MWRCNEETRSVTVDVRTLWASGEKSTPERRVKITIARFNQAKAFPY